jgi:hypothetical protein
VAMTPESSVAAIGIDIDKNSFHVVVGLDRRGAIDVVAALYYLGQIEDALANMDAAHLPPKISELLDVSLGVLNNAALELLSRPDAVLARRIAARYTMPCHQELVAARMAERRPLRDWLR